ncbi:hypothetical protein Hypma_000049 [Hypsizygus marmoreus]|uniref:Uncharacterized protein n=1 Tax=Hypsizygus marmoreus TaxID=39966 RepID=A0A369KCD4_HYPMA|nr:hypothetical protein Hypma_000049 [Hypsizygus marmoreus]
MYLGIRGLSRYTPSKGQPKRKKGRQIISTLHPDRIRDSDYMDLSSGPTRKLIFAPTTTSPSTLSYYGGNKRLHCFPGHCRGFLYYHRDPTLPPESAAVRFRLTTDTNASSFKNGADLMQPIHGRPWSVCLLSIAKSRCYVSLKELLLRDKLVTLPLLEHCR